MNPSATSSGPSTGATSPSGPAKPNQTPSGPPKESGHKVKATLSESDYLKQQADDAVAAMHATLHDVASSLKGTVDITAWTRQYPFIASGSAMAAGFIAAYALVPDKSVKLSVKEANGRWGKVKAAWADVLRPEHEKAEAEARHAEAEERARRESHDSGWLGSVLREVVKMVRPVLISLITGAIRPPQPAPEEQATNGE